MVTGLSKKNIGLVSIGVPWFDAGAAQPQLDAAREYLSQFWNVPGAPEVITDPTALQETIEGYLTEHVIDALVLQMGTFPDGEAPLQLAERLRVPVILHALPEPDLEKRIGLNSLCGVNMTTYAYRSLGYAHTAVFGDMRNSQVQAELAANVRGALALAELKRTRLALVGYRAPGFYPSAFDEIMLRRVLGVKIDHITLGEIMLELLTDKRKAAPVSSFPTIEGGELSAEAVAMLERYYAALTGVLDLGQHRLFAIKDWPEVMGLDKPAGIWPALGWMADDGCLLAPEGDVNGAVTVALLNSLTGNIPYFGDVIAWDDPRSELLLWHYGAAPSLARSQDEIRYSQDGREVQFTLKPGVATLARLGLDNGAFRMLAVAVEVQDRPVTLRRASAWVRTPHTPAGDVMRQILNDGWEHHFILVHGDVRAELGVFSRLSGIPLTVL